MSSYFMVQNSLCFCLLTLRVSQESSLLERWNMICKHLHKLNESLNFIFLSRVKKSKCFPFSVQQNALVICRKISMEPAIVRQESNWQLIPILCIKYIAYIAYFNTTFLVLRRSVHSRRIANSKWPARPRL